MKAWTIAAAALSLAALCSCSSSEEETAPPPNANAEDLWSYHIKKAHPQWQQPGSAPAPVQAEEKKASTCPMEAAKQANAAAPAAQQPAPVKCGNTDAKDAQCLDNMKQLGAPLAAAAAAQAPVAPEPKAPEAGLPPASEKPVPANTVFAEPPGFVVNNNIGSYVAPKPEAAKPAPAPQPLNGVSALKGDGFAHYTVKEGDSLWKIAKLVYHKGDKWEKIYDANKDVIKNPNYVKPGTDLKIPAP